MMRKLPSQGVHHIAFSVSRATFSEAFARLDERGIRHSGVQGTAVPWQVGV
jgi:hypothetical protein